jgi:hypothetical protein
MSFLGRLAQSVGRHGREAVAEHRQKKLEQEDIEHTRKSRALQDVLGREELARTEATNVNDGIYTKATRPNVVGEVIRKMGGVGSISRPGLDNPALPVQGRRPMDISGMVEAERKDYRNLPSGGYMRLSQTPEGRERAETQRLESETRRRGELAGKVASSYGGFTAEEIEAYRQNPDATERLLNNRADYLDDSRRAKEEIPSPRAASTAGRVTPAQAAAQARREAEGFAQTLTTQNMFKRQANPLAWVRAQVRNNFGDRLPEAEIQGIAFTVVQAAQGRQGNTTSSGTPRISIDPSRILNR